jgi:hypothetical protein
LGYKGDGIGEILQEEEEREREVWVDMICGMTYASVNHYRSRYPKYLARNLNSNSKQEALIA